MSTWQPPVGIRYSHRPDRQSAPYFLHWRENGQRHAAAYPSEPARETAAKALAEKRKEHSRDVLSFDPRVCILCGESGDACAQLIRKAIDAPWSVNNPRYRS